jgi:hypothetical protein
MLFQQLCLRINERRITGMKEQYTTPEVKIIKFETADVITTSGADAVGDVVDDFVYSEGSD